MKIENQAKAISKVLGYSIEDKVKGDPSSIKSITKNIDINKIDNKTKEKILKSIELDLLKSYIENIDKYNGYSSNQIYNIRKAYEEGIDVNFVDSIEDSPSIMMLKRKILLFNKQNPSNVFNLGYFSRFNTNKVSLLFNVLKYNAEHPDNKLDISIIEKEYNLDEAKRIFNSHIGYKPEVKPSATYAKPNAVNTKPIEAKEEIEEEVAPPPKTVVKKEEVKKPSTSAKDAKDMTYGELADVWNTKHPKAQINASLIYAQKNKKVAEMLYVTSIYNLKFKNRKIDLNIFTNSDFDFLQKNEILSGIKYNLKNPNNTIPVEKYIDKEIPVDNMKFINRIMRLKAEYDVEMDNIDYILANFKDRTSLSNLYSSLFKQVKK